MDGVNTRGSMRYLIIHRPGGLMGGDTVAARGYADGLRDCGVEVDIAPATAMPDVSTYDWVHMWSANAPQWGLPTVEAVKQRGCRLIITPNWWSRRERLDYYGYHEQDVAPGYTGAVAKTLPKADILFVCTMSEAVQCWRLVPYKQVYAFGHGCDIGEVEKRDAEDYVVCLARIEPHKNQYNTAMACKALGLPLKLIGAVGDQGLLAQAKALGAEYCGAFAQPKALQVLSRARVHCLPSFSETPGMSNMEAALLNVPAVMGNIGAEPEFFGYGGIYADPTDWRNIARGIEVAWARKRVHWANIPTWKQIAERTVEFLGAMEG